MYFEITKCKIFLGKELPPSTPKNQDQAMYMRTSFRGAKSCKIGEKIVIFCHFYQFWKGHNGKIKEKTCKNAELGSIFILGKYVLRMSFESPFTRMISNFKIHAPPPPIYVSVSALLVPGLSHICIVAGNGVSGVNGNLSCTL